MSLLSFRSFTVAAVMATAAASASALTIPTDFVQADSFQNFSDDALTQYDLFSITVTPLGNATPTATVGSYNLPVTSITINSSLKIASGAASGSALEIARIYRGAKVGVTIANFKIDFINHKVLADFTPIGGTTIPQMAVYSFNEAQALTLKYKFPLSVTGTQILDKLYLIPEAIAPLANALKLPAFAPELMKDTDFGKINIIVKAGLRTPVSTKPYVPAN
ncbi:hypothetical protein [Aquabacterium sp.]|uniref:hypothetical protein n=1 Tax=Aquabacterium sp. TaxID=1872578 RepID=UPI002E3062AC|nr:hypothetical protein [Aquabacterium sp.]HEX5311244.1 hypothetical protein [Aquabacterium sp.]